MHADTQAGIYTGRNTDPLKLLAAASMAADHAGAVFFPQAVFLRWIGRLAFPLLCFCLTVGLLNTRDMRRYLLRLGALALISQPFYILAFHPWDWQGEWWDPNGCFTLFFSLLAMWGVQQRRWWLFGLAGAVMCLAGLECGAGGVIWMLIFYLCRHRPDLGASLFVLAWLPALWSGDPSDLRCPAVAGHAVDWSVFGALAAIPIYLPAGARLRIPRWVFYLFYPVHLAVIGIVRLVLGV